MKELAAQAESEHWPSYIATLIAAAAARESRLIANRDRQIAELMHELQSVRQELQAAQVSLAIHEGRPLPYRVRESSDGSWLDAEP